MGNATGSQVDALLRSMLTGDHRSSERARITLRRLGSDAVPILVEKLGAPTSSVRWAVVRVLGDFGVDAQPATSRLVLLLRDSLAQIRAEAARALGQIGHSDPDVVSLLVQRLADNESSVRTAAATALGRFGSDAKSAIQPLIKAADDPNPHVRVAAAAAVWSIDNSEKRLIPKLIEALQDRDREVAGHARNALCKMGQASLPHLLRGLKHNDISVRTECARAIGEMASAYPYMEGAIPALIESLQHDATSAHAMALGQFGPEAVEAVPTLIQLVGSKKYNESGEGRDFAVAFVANDMIRNAACEALVRIGTVAMPQLAEALRNGIREPNGEVCLRIAKVLGDIHEDSVESISALREMLTHENMRKYDGLKTEAAIALGRFGPLAKDAVDDLVSALKDFEIHLHEEVAKALGLIGELANAAIPVLVELLERSGDGQVQLQAAIAIWRIGHRADIAVPALIRRVQAGNSADCIQAASALIEIGHQAKPAVPILREALHVKNDWLRMAYAYALWQIQRDDAGVPLLAQMLRYGKRDVRCEAALVLGEIGPAAHQTVPELIEALREESSPTENTLACEAARALGRIGSMARPALQALTEATEFGGPILIQFATEAINSIVAATKDIAGLEKNESDTNFT